MRDYESTLKQARTCAQRKYCDIGGNCEYYDLDVCCQGGEKDILNDAADAIEELLAAVPQWISVGRNNLPEHEVIAVNAKPGSYGYKEMLVGMVFYSEEEGFFACESDEGAILINVTHYMEKLALPEPPKEDA